MKNLLKRLFCILLLANSGNEVGAATCNAASCTVSCTGHDACKNYEWNGPYQISCGASNSERTCKNTVLNCNTGNTCSIKTQGSGHDAYQSSTVNAKEADSFTLTCTASGQRDCKSITVWCPQKSGTTCDCVSCPNTVTFKCVQGVGCAATSNANVDYVESSIASSAYSIPDEIWKPVKDQTGKRPDCPFSVIPEANQNYKWGTLEKCKETCLNEPTGHCNALSRYGEVSKSATEPWHCRFYACSDPSNFTWVTQEQWGNYANEANTYLLPIRHYQEETCTNIINKTVYNTETVYVYRNISDYFYDEAMIADICEEGIGDYYSTSTNEAWTRKSWYAGCNHFKNGDATSLSQCKSKCNCASSPSSFSSHSQYRQCSKNSASTNYITCRQNSCSGGNCCSRSATICKNACKAYYAIQFSGEMITYKNVDVMRYHDVYTNKTRYINVTREQYLNMTRWVNRTRWENKTRWTDKTRWINKTRWTDKTRWENKTRWINNTRWTDKTRWVNKTRWNDKTRWTNKTRLVNKTRWINDTRIVNKTRWVDKVRWNDKTRIVNKTRWTNKTRWVDRIRLINKTRIITIYKNVTTKVEKPTGVRNESNQMFRDESRDVPSFPVSGNSSCCDCNEDLNTTLLSWQIAAGGIVVLFLLYCGLRECLCSEIIESIEFCEKIANICMCCKEICCGEEDDNNQTRDVEIPGERSFGEVRRTYYEPNPMLVRERQTELPKKRVEI